MPRLHSHAETNAYIEHCVDILKKSGARITQPRLAVLACLAAAKQALGPKDLLEAMRSGRKKSVVDLATIYRILEAFADLGLVHRIGTQGGFVACAHIDCDVSMHVVTHCLTCDKVQEVDLPPDLQNAVSVYVRSATRFRPTDHFLQMTGLCSDCNSKAKTAKAR